MKILSFIVKQILNFIAWFLKLSRHNIYYLVSGPLKNEIKAESAFAFAYEHIESAIATAQSLKNNYNGKSSIILDVGGGQATTARIFAKYYPKIPIFVFEPIKSNFSAIEKSPDRTANWQLINKAVGCTVGTSVINIAQRVTASSLLELNTDDLNENTYKTALKLQNTEEIKITTLDLEAPKDAIVEVLKLDVQGFELEVLKGATTVLPRTKVIVLEINNHQGFKNGPTYHEIDAFLREHNFELFNIYPGFRDRNKLMDWDSIYVNQAFL